MLCRSWAEGLGFMVHLIPESFEGRRPDHRNFPSPQTCNPSGAVRSGPMPIQDTVIFGLLGSEITLEMTATLLTKLPSPRQNSKHKSSRGKPVSR